jgi:hypothetical protein
MSIIKEIRMYEDIETWCPGPNEFCKEDRYLNFYSDGDIFYKKEAIYMNDKADGKICKTTEDSIDRDNFIDCITKNNFSSMKIFNAADISTIMEELENIVDALENQS